MSGETRIIKKIGNYSFWQAEPDDCLRCHNAKYGTVLIGGICLDCFKKTTIEENIINDFKKMCEQSLSPETFEEVEEIIKQLKETRHIE